MKGQIKVTGQRLNLVGPCSLQKAILCGGEGLAALLSQYVSFSLADIGKRKRKRRSYASGSSLKHCIKEGPTPTATRARTRTPPPPGRSS
eukprot:1095158-Pelagomonas_calceolata.AAC.1